MGDVIDVRTRKHEEPPKKTPPIWLLIIGAVGVGFTAVVGIIAGAIYLWR